MLSERIGSSMKKGWYCSTARQRRIASGGSRRVWMSKQSSISSPTASRTASNSSMALGMARRGSRTFPGSASARPQRTNFQPSATCRLAFSTSVLDRRRWMCG